MDQAGDETDFAAGGDHFRGGAGADGVGRAGFGGCGGKEGVLGGVEGGVGHEEVDSGEILSSQVSLNLGVLITFHQDGKEA